MSPETAEAAGAAFVDTTARPLSPLPPRWRSLGGAFAAQAREGPGRPAMVDSTGAALTYGDALLRAAALGRALKRELGTVRFVGVMIPPTAPAAIANISLTLLGKIPVNLNYTASQTLVDSSIDQCGIKHVLTSRKVLDRFKIEPKGTLLLLEDLAKKVTTLDKIWAAAVAKVVPASMLGAFLPGLKGGRLDEEATVIFTSGSTGDPKGVVLSHRNVLSNIHQIQEHVALTPDEVVLSILPFFHSFGFTVGLWAVQCLGFKAVYHFNPLDAKIVGNLCGEHGATILFGSPTFMRAYVHRCDREQFAKMRLPILGAEKLKPELARDIREKLGIEPLEGYGCTETGPVVSVNVLDDVKTPDGRTVPGNRPGTVGRPLPGTSVKAVDIETGADLPPGSEGVIQVKGPQVMAGYLGRPDATAKVLRDGWYSTGDLGVVDPDGFLTITDRLSRFSKIGGEMVPHMGVESAIMEAAGVDEQCVAVTSLPDPKRGERLVVVYTDLGAPPQEIYKRLSAGPWPKLWLPAIEDFQRVEALPILGTGKLDLRRLRQIAKERADA